MRFLDWLFAANVLLYMLHASAGGDRYGPRYWFGTYPFLVLSVAAAAGDIVARDALSLRGVRVSLGLASHMAATLAAMLVLPVFLRALIGDRAAIYDYVGGLKLKNSVVVISERSPGRDWDAANLTRNGISLTAPVIYALQTGAEAKLRQMFPGRDFYYYDQQDDARTARLVPCGVRCPPGFN